MTASNRKSLKIYICIYVYKTINKAFFFFYCTPPPHTHTFVAHHWDLHASLAQHPQAFPFKAVLHVTEVKARDKDPEAKVGHVPEELGELDGAVDTGRPGAEPGDGVTEPLLSDTSITPQTRAQGPQVAQEEQLYSHHKQPNLGSSQFLPSGLFYVHFHQSLQDLPLHGNHCDCGGVRSQRSACRGPLAASQQSRGRSRVGPAPTAHSCNGRETFF